MERCLRLAGIDRNAALHILDIGSGSGGSVFAAAQLIPGARIVASDISPHLLNIFGSAIEKEDGLRSRVTACCFDLHQPFFEQNQFDLVIGWAILHHLADPLAALQNVVYALKPGGHLLLNEPFEAGNMLLYAMYEKIIKYLTDAGDPDGTLAKIMRAMRFDFQHRLGVPALKPWTLMLDDKWLFDEPYLQQLGSELAFDSVETYPITDDLGHLYEGTFRSLMHETGQPRPGGEGALPIGGKGFIDVQGKRAGKVVHHPPQRGRGAGREERHGVLQPLLVRAQQEMDTDQCFDTGEFELRGVLDRSKGRRMRRSGTWKTENSWLLLGDTSQCISADDRPQLNQ